MPIHLCIVYDCPQHSTSRGELYRDSWMVRKHQIAYCLAFYGKSLLALVSALVNSHTNCFMIPHTIFHAQFYTFTKLPTIWLIFLKHNLKKYHTLTQKLCGFLLCPRQKFKKTGQYLIHLNSPCSGKHYAGHQTC